MQYNKKSSTRFSAWLKIFTVIKKYLLPLRIHFLTHKISKNRHMKYNVWRLLHQEEVFTQVIRKYRGIVVVVDKNL